MDSELMRSIKPTNLGTLLFGASGLVVSNDAPALVKSAANIGARLLGTHVYVCDGVADQAQIKAVGDALHALGGGTIFLPRGSYNLAGGEKPNIASHLKLRGEGGTLMSPVSGQLLARNWTYDTEWYNAAAAQWWLLTADAANWTVISGTAVISDDAGDYQAGAGSLKAAVTVAPCEIKRDIDTIDLSRDGMIAIWVKTSDVLSTPTKVRLWSGAAYLEWQFKTRAPSAWVELYCPFDAYDAYLGTMDLTAITGLSFVMAHASDHHFDEFRSMPADIVIEDMAGTSSADIVTGTWMSFKRAFNVALRGLSCRNIGDNPIELHGCRNARVTDFTLAQRYDPVGEGGPTIDMAPSQCLGLENENMNRGRFGKVTNGHIYSAGNAVVVCGEYNLVDGVSCSCMGHTVVGFGDARGVELRHTYTTQNIIRNMLMEGMDHAIRVYESAYGNIIDGVVAQMNDSCKGLWLYTTAGPDNMFSQIRLTGVGTGYGVCFDGTSANRTLIRQSYFKNFATGVEFAVGDDDCRVEDTQFVDCATGINIHADCERTICRHNRFSGVTTPIVDAGIDSKFDLDIMPPASLDLSGAAIDIPVFTAVGAHYLCGYTVLYTEASSAAPNTTKLQIGRLQADGTFDDDYYDECDSEWNRAFGRTHRFRTADLREHDIATGETVTIGTNGGKIGTGEVKIILHIAELGT